MDRHSGDSGFWWRAAEPIPAKPEPLVIPADDEPVAPPSSKQAADDAAPVKPSIGQRAKPMFKRDLGALRPGRYMRTDRVVARVRSPSGVGRAALLTASLAGVVAFGATTEFGRNVRDYAPIGTQIDAALVRMGLGIDEISLGGHKNTPDKDIFAAIGATGTTLFRLDIEAARRRVEALPWVEEARITRLLPDKLRVDIRERRPAAVWRDGERTALVDPSGRVLGYLGAFVPADLPKIAGDGAPEAAGPLLSALAGVPDLQGKLVVATRIGGRRWDLQLAEGLVLRLASGHPKASLDRLMSLESASKLLSRKSVAIDLTVEGQISIRPPVRTSRQGAHAAHDAASVMPL